MAASADLRRGGLPLLSLLLLGCTVAVCALDITYHSGLVLTGDTAAVNVIYYGTFAPADHALMTYFLEVLPAMDWFQGIAAYSNPRTGRRITGLASPPFTNPPFRNYTQASFGANLTNHAVRRLLVDAIENKHLGRGADDDMYFVVMSNTTGAPGLCTSWCARHDYLDINHKRVKYALIGNPRYCSAVLGMPYRTCTPLDPAVQYAPNGPFTVDMDQQVSLLSQQLVGIMTNPFKNGWHDADGLDAAQKCAGVYHIQHDCTGTYSEHFGDNRLWVQKVWTFCENATIPQQCMSGQDFRAKCCTTQPPNAWCLF